jgi:hypothetical protein
MIKKIINFFYVILLAVNFSSCKQKIGDKLVKNNSSSSIIENSIGVIVMSENCNFGDTIKLLNHEGNVQHSIVFEDEKNIIDFRCIDTTNNYYIIRTVTNDTLLIDRKSDKVIFQTWEEHLLNYVSSITFDIKTNPLRKEPSENSEQIILDENISDIYFFPSRIKGEWLEVKWYKDTIEGYEFLKLKKNVSFPSATQPIEEYHFLKWRNTIEKRGWIKWKDKDKLIIELYYLCNIIFIKDSATLAV